MIKRLIDYDNSKPFVDFITHLKKDDISRYLLEPLITAITEAAKAKNVWTYMHLSDLELQQAILLLEQVSDKEISMINKITRKSYLTLISELKGEAD